jgi:hypothetical protein
MKDIPGFPIVDIVRTWWRIFQAFQSFILSVPDEGYSRLSDRWYWAYLMKDISGFPIVDIERTWWRIFQAF